MSSISRLKALKSVLLDDPFGSPTAGSPIEIADEKNTQEKLHFHKFSYSGSYNSAKGRALLKEQLENELFKDTEELEHEIKPSEPSQLNTNESLLQTSHKLRKEAKLKNELDLIKDQEEWILEQVSHSINANLQPVSDRAKGITHERMPSLWTLPRKYKELTRDQVLRIRAKNYIDVNGTNLPPIKSFRDMKFPKPILKYLRKKNIISPTQIQMQAIPAALQGRDVIGIAFTGSGKSMVFILPMVMLSWEFELRLKISEGEGPFALVLCPSRELASQTYSIIDEIADYIYDYGGPKLKTACVIGGVNIFEQSDKIIRGIHMAVATPGRLIDFLEKKRLSLQQCRFICLDEADRLVDLGFEDEVRNFMNYLDGPRQTLFFSATMPKKIQEFAMTALQNPVVINIGRAGAANLNVTQDIEYVPQEMRLPMLLRSLQKSAPPVLIFCENKWDVDEVHEYLLLKGVAAVAIHGGLMMQNRQEAIKAFRNGEKDVLIATDVVSKGLDFPDIKHVINFDMPREIENYVHRIGRTGRSNKKGLSTTFIHKGIPQIVLLDLKTLLIEAKQHVPEMLKTLDSKGLNLESIGGQRGCAFCSGLGHRIGNCPKLESQKNIINLNNHDLLSNGVSRYGQEKGYAGDW